MSLEPSHDIGESRPFPSVLPMRQRSALIDDVLRRRLETILPLVMRESGLDMWIILCQ